MSESKSESEIVPAQSLEAPPEKKHSRSLRNILINPRAQLRFVFGIPFLMMLAMAVLFRELENSLLMRLEALKLLLPATSAPIEELEQAVHSLLVSGIAFALLSAFLILILGLSVTHHFYGPLVPLIRKLKKMKEGNFSGRVRLRPNDELKELADAINEVSESLEQQRK